MIGGWWGVARDEGGCWAGWGRGASRGRGWRMLAMTSMLATQSVHALSAIRAKVAGMAVAARRRRTRTSGGDSTVWACYM